jgi:hypothetical protein
MGPRDRCRSKILRRSSAVSGRAGAEASRSRRRHDAMREDEYAGMYWLGVDTDLARTRSPTAMLFCFEASAECAGSRTGHGPAASSRNAASTSSSGDAAIERTEGKLRRMLAPCQRRRSRIGRRNASQPPAPPTGERRDVGSPAAGQHIAGVGPPRLARRWLEVPATRAFRSRSRAQAAGGERGEVHPVGGSARSSSRRWCRDHLCGSPWPVSARGGWCLWRVADGCA